MLKGILDKFLKSKQQSTQSEVPAISHAEVEELVEARLKEHAAAIESTINHQLNQNKVTHQDEDYTLSLKQIEYALSLIEKVKDEFELAINPSNLTIKDLNRLIAYNRYKNKGTLINLVKKGVLRKKANSF
nr:ABC transporter ATP-binding protein [Neobacillus sp. Marseille-Q6967]